jgi:hypothetical protein
MLLVELCAVLQTHCVHTTVTHLFAYSQDPMTHYGPLQAAAHTVAWVQHCMGANSFPDVATASSSVATRLPAYLQSVALLAAAAEGNDTSALLSPTPYQPSLIMEAHLVSAPCQFPCILLLLEWALPPLQEPPPSTPDSSAAADSIMLLPLQII